MKNVYKVESIYKKRNRNIFKEKNNKINNETKENSFV